MRMIAMDYKSVEWILNLLVLVRIQAGLPLFKWLKINGLGRIFRRKLTRFPAS